MGQNISSEAVSSDIDRKQLKQLLRRFLEINDKRKALLSHNLDEKDNNFIQLLPLLFHSNHPMLPGYVGSEAPCGVANYQPDKTTLQVAKKFARSFDYQPRAARQIQIEALYLMGSAGSVAHSLQSDLDVWVCVSSDLSPKQHELLQQKRQNIQNWARQQSIDCSIYLVTQDNIVDSAAENESSTIETRLLLDEFYRTQIHLAGRYLLWWVVPCEQEQHYSAYVDRLIKERHVQQEDFIDFGAIEQIPLNEFISNALWYINKALESPYKTALKLVLMESYLSEYPDVTPLSFDYKSYVHSMMDNATVSDAYLLMHRKVEEYLTANEQSDRLEFVRRCLYHKIHTRLTRQQAPDSPAKAVIDELVKEWNWSAEKRELFDHKSKWDINQIGNEKRLYIKQLISSFRTIGQFIKLNESFFEKYKNDLLCLSRKISANLELTHGKIERVNINFVAQMLDKHLSLVRQSKAKNLELWSFYDRAVSQQEAQSVEPVYQCSSLLELLVWAKVNGVLNEGTSVQYRDSKQLLQYDELERIIQVLLSIQYEKIQVSDSAYLNSPTIKHISCFINIAQDKLTGIAKQGMHIITKKNDPFCFGNDCHNLIETIDLYYVNSWGEQFVVHFKGEQAVSEAAIALLELIDRQSVEPELNYYSFSSMRADEVVTRLKNFYRHLILSYQGRDAHVKKYIFRLGTRYCVIEKQNEKFIVHNAATEDQLSQLIINQFNQYQLIEFDSRCFPDPVIRTALQRSKPGEHFLIVNPKSEYSTSYCFVDQYGGVVYGFFNPHNYQEDIGCLHQFLTNSCAGFDETEFRCYLLNQDQSLSRYDINTLDAQTHGDISISFNADSKPETFNVTCHQQSFTFEQHDPELSNKFIAWLDRLQLTPEQVTISKLTLSTPEELLSEAKLLLERNLLFQSLFASL
jgi:adenylate cyclase class 1